MRRRPTRAAALFAMIAALFMVGPLAWLAVAQDPPPDPPDTGNVVPVDPGVTDGLTGGVLPSLPIPANPVPGSLPTVPTDLDPQDESDVGADGEPVTVELSGKASATVTFTGRQVSGAATGLNPSKRYITALYGDMSTDRPGEVLTCADVRTAADVRSWSVSGEWEVDGNGNGTLSGTASRDLADGVYTVSIRRAGGLQATSLGTDPLTGFTPVTSPVVACGAVPGA